VDENLRSAEGIQIVGFSRLSTIVSEIKRKLYIFCFLTVSNDRK
jgi:hypothetical protein